MTAPESSERRSVLVWDAPVRVFHWLLVLSFAGAFVSAESERWRLLHVTLGYTAGGLVLFRALWGLMGTRHARFASFVRGPRAVAAYLRGLLARDGTHPVGHNPAGGWAIVGLLALTLLVAASGLATYNDWGGGWLEELHEGAANTMLALVVVHVLGVVVGSRVHRENLVRAMVTGRKNGRVSDGIAHAWRGVAALMLAAVLGFWSWQWTQAPDAATLQAQAAARTDRHQGHHDDDD
ncbi:MAG: cytochrome b/b6 domain-containing protein [Rubrivivax sp.]